MPTSETFNVNCMEFMRSLPDGAFDLAVVDPPYGGGFTEGGGCKGWFAKYHRDEARSQTVQVERERERENKSRITASEIQKAASSDISVNRTGGTWATKYGKKS